MSRSSRFVYLLLSLAVAFVVHVGSARADSDRMVVTNVLSGNVFFDQSIPEPAVAGLGESSLFFAPSGGTAPPPDFNPALTYVVLSEPAGAAPEPGDESPIFLPGTETIVSDLVIGSFQSGGQFAAGVQLLSDGDPNLLGLVETIPAAVLQIIPETGDLEDVTGLLGSGPAGLRVQVQSDVVVPEPGTFALLGVGLLGLAAQGRQRRPLGGSR